VPTISRLRHNLTFAHVVEGETQAGHKLHCECAVIDQLTHAGISVEAVDISVDGCSFIIEGRDAKRFTGAVRDLNVAVTVRERCARVALTRSATDWPLPPLVQLMHAFENDAIDVVHLAADASSVTVIVNEHDADRVGAVFSRFYQRQHG
jgi:aspartokinase